MSTLKLDEIKSLQGTGNTVITFNSEDKAVFASQPVVPVPVFMAYRDTSTQSVTSGTNTKVQLNALEYDTNSWFDATTNYRYTPQIAGYYQFNALIYFSGTGLTNGTARIYKNGNVTIDGHFLSTTSASFLYAMSSGVIYLNGTTDYVELFGYVVGTNPLIRNDVNKTWLQGFLVRAA